MKFLTHAGMWLIAITGAWSTARAADVSAFTACRMAGLSAQVAAKAQCGTVTVAENRGAPEGRKLILPVLKIPASGKNPGVPLFVLNGGPGDPNLGQIRSLTHVAARHDVYYVGYRGADGAVLLNCTEIADLIEVPDVLGPANLQRLTAASGACAKRLDHSGLDLSHYTMFDVIEDVEAVRSGLGYAKINLFSNSYGTRVAQFYTRRHPGSVWRSVMLGANPPGHFVFSAYVNDRSLDRIAQLCAADAYCAARTPDLKRTILKALSAGKTAGNRQIDDGKTRLALFLSMYSRERMVAFIDAAIAAEHNDLSQLGALGKLAAAATKGAVWGDLLSKGYTDGDRYAEFAPTFAATPTSMGSPLDTLFAALLAPWPKADMPPEYHRAALDRTETLIVNGDLDSTTPLIFVEAELMNYLPNGQLLVLKDYAHSDDHRQADALDQIVAGYLDTGRVNGTLLKDDPYVFRK